MRNYLKLAFRRVVMVGLSLVFQLVFLVGIIGRFSDYTQWFTVSMYVLSWISVVVIISQEHTDPTYKIAWIIPILTLPVFGISFYILFGGNRLSKRLKRSMQKVEQIQRNNLTQETSVMKREAALSYDAAIQSNYLLRIADSPVYEKTETFYYPTGEEGFPHMLEAIANAKHYIFLEYFIIQEGVMWDQILTLLRKKAASGVDVRLMYDDFGCITTLPARYYKKLEAVGIKTAVFNPFVPVLSSRLNNRDHRKFLIVDGTVGFTGGINLADEYINKKERFGYWKDNIIQLKGDGVWSMTIMFLSLWIHTKGGEETISHFKPTQPPRISDMNYGFVQPFADTPLDNEAVGETVFFNLITKAKKYVHIMTPYLIISDKMISTLCIAAKSGIDVRIITPGIPDKPYVYEVTRAHYAALCKAGVHIHEYTPGFIHSKVFCVDDEYAVVGTVNFDFRSLYLHFENGIWMYRSPCIAEVVKDFRETLSVCHEVTLAEAQSVNAMRRLFRSALRVFSPLM